MTINQSMTKHILGRVFNFLTSSPFRQTGNVQLNKAQTLLSAKILYGGFNEFESDLCSNDFHIFTGTCIYLYGSFNISARRINISELYFHKEYLQLTRRKNVYNTSN